MTDGVTRIARWDGRNRVTFDTRVNVGDLKLHLDDIKTLTGRTGTIRGGGHGNPVTGAFRYDPEARLQLETNFRLLKNEGLLDGWKLAPAGALKRGKVPNRPAGELCVDYWCFSSKTPR